MRQLRGRLNVLAVVVTLVGTLAIGQQCYAAEVSDTATVTDAVNESDTVVDTGNTDSVGVDDKTTVNLSVEAPVKTESVKTVKIKQESVSVATAPGLTVLDGVDYSAVYDYNWYIAHNPDVYAAFNGDQVKTLQHFIKYGMKEGRTSKEDFELVSYMKAYPDLRKAFRNDNAKYYIHYMNYGKKEGRVTKGVTELKNPTSSYDSTDYKLVYDYGYYIAHNPDVKNALGAYNDYGIIEHFVRYGMNEKRHGNESFDVTSYANAYADLRVAFGVNWKSYYEHYIKYGNREGRKTSGVKEITNPVTVKNGVDYSKVYNYKDYLKNNKDIAKSIEGNDYAALDHFINKGMNERRKGNDTFDVVSYAYAYKDLRNAFGSNWKSYYEHYIKYGCREGRITSGVTELRGYETNHILGDYAALFDYNYYTKNNPDVLKVLGPDEDAVLNHFVKYGLKEGRRAKASYDANLYDQKKALSNDLYKPNYKNGWLKYKNTWYRYNGNGDIYTVQTDAPRVTTLAGFYVSPMKTGNLNSRKERIEAMIARAYEYMGTQYRICKSTAPGGACDCSGLVMQCLYAAGFDPYPATPAHHARPENEYDSRTLFNQTPMKHISYNNHKRGDLIYYKSGRGNIIIHVAIDLGNGRVIESWPPRVTDKYGITSSPHPYIYGATRPFT